MKKYLIENYKFGDIKEYLIYFEPTTPFENGFFTTYDSEKELLLSLKYNLLDFCKNEKDDLTEMKEIIKKSFPDTVQACENSFLQKIDHLLSDIKILYVGTLNDLLKSNSTKTKWFRKQFREEYELEGNDKPIKKNELEIFKNYLLPDWLR